MARVLLTVRVAASLWHLFQLALFQERLTMQRWVERAVSRTLRGERRAKEGSRWKGKVGRTENRGPVKQIVARLEKDQLTGLQTICRAEGIPLKAWLLREIEDYVEQQRVRGIELFSPEVRRKVRSILPSEGTAQDRIVRLLLAWPEAAILEALKSRQDRLREAIKAGEFDLVSRVLEVAHLRQQIMEKERSIQHRRESLFSKR